MIQFSELEESGDSGGFARRGFHNCCELRFVAVQVMAKWSCGFWRLESCAPCGAIIPVSGVVRPLGSLYMQGMAKVVELSPS